MKALIQGTRVCEIKNEEYKVHPSLKWVDVDDTITTRHTYVNGVFIPPAPATLPPTKDEIYARSLRNSKVLKAVILSLNDGTLIPGANVSNAELKAIIKAKL